MLLVATREDNQDICRKLLNKFKADAKAVKDDDKVWNKFHSFSIKGTETEREEKSSSVCLKIPNRFGLESSNESTPGNDILWLN